MFHYFSLSTPTPQAGYLWSPRLLWENYPHTDMPLSLKFYMLTQVRLKFTCRFEIASAFIMCVLVWVSKLMICSTCKYFIIIICNVISLVPQMAFWLHCFPELYFMKTKKVLTWYVSNTMEIDHLSSFPH